MKKFVIILAALFLIDGACFASSPKTKELQKECKRVCKELKSNGWKVYGKLQTLEEALKDHFRVLEESGDSLLPITGFGSAKSANLAARRATNHATVQYASMKGSMVESTASTTINTTQASDEVTSKTVFDATHRTTTEQNIKAMTPNLTVYRTLADGTVEMQAFFLVKHILD